ncbi:MAG: carbon-nitrogen hydrolase family protein [Cytophagales bacterium]|nr:carbon-nitrogen hydrolase family protein [Cytophagales bacterium]
MKIASAQIESSVGNIRFNLEHHYRMIEFAGQNGVDLIAFPEMSITGYCREEGKALAFNINDARLNKLKALSQKFKIAIIAGAPIEIQGKLFIGSFIIKPGERLEIYTKQFLHSGEDKFYNHSFYYNPIIELRKERISLAICADINCELHPRNAKRNKCTIYVSSIFFSANGIDQGHKMLSEYAKENEFMILMSNYCGKHWNLESGGKSAFWDKEGKLLAELDSGNAGLLIAEQKSDNWTANIFEERAKRLVQGTEC